MQTQPKPAVRTSRTSHAVARREHRGNVIHWQGEALERHLRQLPLPTAPGEDNTPELVRPWVQDLVIGLVAGAAIVLAIASGAGAL